MPESAGRRNIYINMKFQEFEHYAVNHIKDFLPDEYQDAKVKTGESLKANESYNMLNVIEGPNVASPSINLDEQYEKLQAGHTIESVMLDMAERVQMNVKDIQVSETGSVVNGIDLNDYESVKPHLFVRLSRPERAAKLEGKVPVDRTADLTMTYHIHIGSPDGGMSNAMVTNELLGNLGVSKEQLHKDAVANTYDVLGMRLGTLADVVDSDLQMPVKDSYLFLTSEAGVNGASLMVAQLPDHIEGMTFLDYALKEVNCEELAESMRAGNLDADCEVNGFYVIPSSIHEVILIPDHGQDIDIDELQSMIQNVNQMIVDPTDRLSDEPYHWNEDRGLELAETYLEAREAERLSAVEIER